MLLLYTKGHALLNTFRNKISNQAIFNQKGKIKKSEKLGKPGQVKTCKLVLYTTLQTFKNQIIQIHLWRLNKQIISTPFVYILSAYIKAMTEIS